MIPDKLTYHLILLKVGTIGEKTDAARWLGEHKIAIAVPLLCEALSSSEGDFRGWAACALGEIGEQSAIIPLQMALVREKKLFRRDRFAISLPNAYDSITWALDQLTGEH